MWRHSHYQSLSEKKVLSCSYCSFLGDSTCHHPSFSLTYSQPLGILSRWPSTALSSLFGPVLRIFSWFLSRQIQNSKEHRKAVHEHDFSKQARSKLFQVLVQTIDGSLMQDVAPICVYLLASSVCIRILTSISATPVIAILLLMVLSFLLSLCSEADAFVGSSLLTSFGVAPVLAFLVIGPMLDVKNLLMMKNYLKARFIWQFIGIVSGVVLLYAWFVGVVL